MKSGGLALFPPYPYHPRNPRSNSPKKFPGAVEEAFVERRVFFSAESREFLQLLALLAVQTRGHFNEEPREQVAAITSIHVHDAFAPELEDLAALSSGGHFQVGLSFEGRDGDLAPKRGEREGDRHFTIKIVVFALENGVLFDVNDDVKVTRGAAANSRLAIARGTQARSIGDAGRNLQLDAAAVFGAPFASAGATWFLDDLADAATTRTGLRNLKKSARADDLPASAAGGTIDRPRARLGAFAAALPASVE